MSDNSKNIIIVNENECYMEITRKGIKYKIYIDKEDIDKINVYKWHLHCRNKDNRLDVCTNTYGSYKDRKYISLPRYLLNPPKDLVIDHINRNTLDNRKDNLRIVTIFENNLNKSNNTSGCIGVVFDKSKNNYMVIFKNKYIGRFKDFNKAVEVRKNLEKEYFSNLHNSP